MASPIAHSLAGFWMFLVFVGRSKFRLISQWRKFLPHLCVLVLVANLPDFDVILGLAIGRDLHHGFSHSLAAATLVALACSCLWKIAEGFWRSAALYFAAYCSHLLIDLFTGVELGWTHSGSGIPLLWPLPKKGFSSPLILVYGVRHGSFWKVFSEGNLRTGCYELLVFGGITIVLLVWRARYVRKSG